MFAFGFHKTMIRRVLETFATPFLSGAFAALASVFGKFASSDHSIYSSLSSSSVFLPSAVRLMFVTLVIICNAVQWRFQLWALSDSDATFPVTISTLAANIFVASVSGFLLFAETITISWVSTAGRRENFRRGEHQQNCA